MEREESETAYQLAKSVCVIRFALFIFVFWGFRRVQWNCLRGHRGKRKLFAFESFDDIKGNGSY